MITQWRLRVSKQSSICSRGAVLGHPMDPVVSVKQKLLRKHKVSCKSFWSRIVSLKSFTLTIPWNLAKPVKIFLGIIVRQHHTDRKQMGLLREWKEGTPAVIIAIWSGWKLVGRFHWMLYLSAKLSRSLVWWKNCMRKAFWRTIQRTKTSQESTNLERKSYLDCSLDTLCTRVEFGRVT